MMEVMRSEGASGRVRECEREVFVLCENKKRKENMVERSDGRSKREGDIYECVVRKYGVGGSHVWLLKRNLTSFFFWVRALHYSFAHLCCFHDVFCLIKSCFHDFDYPKLVSLFFKPGRNLGPLLLK